MSISELIVLNKGSIMQQDSPPCLSTNLYRFKFVHSCIDWVRKVQQQQI